MGAKGNYSNKELSEEGSAVRSQPRERGLDTKDRIPVLFGEEINLEKTELNKEAKTRARRQK